MRTYVKKIVAWAIVGAMSVTLAPQMEISNAKADVVETLSYEFKNNTKGIATGCIRLKITIIEKGTNESYSIYWVDQEGKKLTKSGIEYTEITQFTADDKYSTLTSSYDYHIESDYAAIPENAAGIIAVDEDEDEIAYADIPEEKRPDWGESTDEFALMSDIHYNRYPEESSALAEDKDLSVISFGKAMQFVDARGIKKVFVAGDLSNQGEVDSYNKYNKTINKYPEVTVYTCMGNHDVSWTKSADPMVAQFKKYVNTKKNSDSNVVQIAPNNLDFVYRSGEDYVIFFSQTRARYSKNSVLVTDEQLDWLHRTLNSLADKNVYLVFHTYLADYTGSVETAVGNLVNPAGYSYNLTYPYGAVDEVRLRSILNKYSNVTMISGHSHWAYDQIKYNDNLVIGNVNKAKSGATLLHLSSVGAPRTIEADTTKRTENFGFYNELTGDLEGKLSEGTIATRYNNKTIYTGADFIKGKYLGYCVYVAADGAKHAPEAELKLAKTKITKVGKVKKVSKKSKKYKVKITYKKVAKRYKYQIQYSTSSKFKSVKNKYTTKTSYTITKLKRKTKYYVRVRAYAYQFGARVNAAWSAKKKIKTKK